MMGWNEGGYFSEILFWQVANLLTFILSLGHKKVLVVVKFILFLINNFLVCVSSQLILYTLLMSTNFLNVHLHQPGSL